MSPLRRIGALFVFTLAGTACAPADRTPPGATVRDSSGVEIVENDPASDAVCRLAPMPRIDIGTVAGDEVQQLFRVFDATRLPDGRIAVVNQGSDEIRVFDAAGAFLYAFGRAGGGPGEFRDVFQIWSLPGDTLVVGDFRPWRFSTFTAEGTFVRAVEPAPLFANPPAAMGLLDDGTSVLAADCCFDPAPGFHDRYLHVTRHAPAGELLDTIGVWPYGRWGEVGDEEIQLIAFPLFEAFARMDAAGNRIVASAASEPDIEVMDGTGRLIRRIRWADDDRAVRPADVETLRRSRLERATTPRARQFAEAAVGEHMPVNERFPAISELRLSRTGEIWVERHRRPDDDGPDQWLVFSPDGRFRCHTTTPAGLSIYEIGPDYLLGKQLDTLEVEHVVLFDRLPD